uniref:Type I restriction enzyme endonuclease subunit n=1 Tax=candidate division WOR-3 bacterium TaxID=2052148 RepID=A0A7C6AFM6_UNCW3
MPNFSESSLEDYIIEELVKSGWRFVPSDELERESLEEPLLVPVIVRCIQRINKDINLGDDEISKVLNELKLVTTGQEGAKKILNFFKFGVPIKLEKERVVHYVQLFDYKGDNEFVVSRQVWYAGKDKIRTDIMLYVNGIPLVNIEIKDPTKFGLSWYDAFVQIKDYEITVPELFKYVQIGVAVESQARYFPIVPWQAKEEVKCYEWRKISEIKESDPIEGIFEMLEPERLLDIIKNFLFYRIEFGNATKVITRYMQYRAVNKMVERVVQNLQLKNEMLNQVQHDRIQKKRGLIWHWQGSGKTLTMVFTAHKLYYNNLLENPSIFFIVDRIELEEQLYTEFYSLDIVQPEVIQTVADLEEVLSYDNYQGKRGLFITLIHKFRFEELDRLRRHLEEISKTQETIMNRSNVIAFIDEGHRSQYGILAGVMKGILKNAFMFALTGTPISKSTRDTYRDFAYLPEEMYLDRYFIVDSIRDGFTLPIVYQPRLEKDVHLKKEMLETFLEIELEEIPEKARTDVEQRLKQRLDPINVFLENEKRIDSIAEDIANHFKENVDGKFKAMIVAASRKACMYYKNALEKHLPREYFEVVMTAESDEDEIIYGYSRDVRERYAGRDHKSTLKKIIDKFKEDDYPKILIVTEMLLTGFDAPILQVMYLDKPLKEHRLLQAIARTNRPYKGLKEAGIIIDYVGILKEFKRAFELYSKEDSLKGALSNMENIHKEFDILISELTKMFGGLNKNYDRISLLKAIEILTTDVLREEEFVEKYRKLRKLFEILGSDPHKLECFEEYKWLSAIYVYYIKTVLQKSGIDPYVHKYFDKTLRYVYKTTEIDNLEKDLPVIKFDVDTLKNIEERVKSREEKAANILFTLQRFVLVDKQKNPIYESLTDRVQRLVDMWREKTKDYEKIYKEGVSIFEAIQTMASRQQRLGLSDLEYALLLALENKLEVNEEFVNRVKILVGSLRYFMFSNWIMQPTACKNIEREVRKFVRGLKKEYNLTIEEMNDIYNILMGQIKNYGA